MAVQSLSRSYFVKLFMPYSLKIDLRLPPLLSVEKNISCPIPQRRAQPPSLTNQIPCLPPNETKAFLKFSEADVLGEFFLQVFVML